MPFLDIDGAISNAAALRSPGGSTITVTSGHGPRFGNPSPTNPVLIQTGDTTTDSRARAYFKCTARSGDALTVEFMHGANETDVVDNVTVSIGHTVVAGDVAARWAEIRAAIAAKQDALPSQSGQSGKVLGTNGTSVSWVSAGGTGTVTSVGLTMPSGFSVGSSPVTASGVIAVTTSLSGIVKGTGSGFAAAVAGTDYQAPLPSQSGQSGKVLGTNGTSLSWVEQTGGGGSGITALTGDVAASGTGSVTATIAAGAVDAGKLASNAVTTGKIADDAVTFAKLLNATGEGIVGASASGSYGHLTLGPNLSISGSTLNASVSASAAGYTLPWKTAVGVDVAAGETPANDAIGDGEVTGLMVAIGTNGGSGGFTLDVLRNGDSILSAPVTVAAGSTTTVNVSSFADAEVEKGDVYTLEFTSVGSGVQNVRVYLSVSPPSD